jgi:uncharacterized protein YndB with AHSA1/START domain
MVDILHRVGIEAPLARVFAAFSTKEGLAGWWTETVTGDDRLGGVLVFHFGTESFNEMKVTALVPNQLVAWECSGGPPEWVGTRLTFELKENGGETVVLFAQRGWKEPVEFMHACSTKWATFLLSAKALVETGRGAPYPYDPKISRWF